METIYLDSLMTLNFLIDYLLLLCAGRICAQPLHRLRIALGGAFGSVYAALAALFPQYFALFTWKLLAGSAMVLLAYGLRRESLRLIIVFFAVSAAFAGAVYAALGLSGGRQRAQFIPVSTHVLVLSFALCYAAVKLVFRSTGAQGARKTHTVELFWGGECVCFTALEDTGNELTDPLTGERVLVVQKEALSGFLPPLQSDPMQALETLNDVYPGRFRLLPCACVAAENALLLCFRPDRLCLDGKEQKHALVAISPNLLSPTGEYQAII